jgi:hypothetical protein
MLNKKRMVHLSLCEKNLYKISVILCYVRRFLCEHWFQDWALLSWWQHAVLMCPTLYDVLGFVTWTCKTPMHKRQATFIQHNTHFI